MTTQAENSQESPAKSLPSRSPRDVASGEPHSPAMAHDRLHDLCYVELKDYEDELPTIKEEDEEQEQRDHEEILSRIGDTTPLAESTVSPDTYKDQNGDKTDIKLIMNDDSTPTRKFRVRIPAFSNVKTICTNLTTMERVLSVALVFLVVLIFIIVLSICVYVARLLRTYQVTPCTSPECLLLSHSVLTNSAFASDPCDGFYEYACGNSPRSLDNSADVFKIKLRDKLKVLLSEDNDNDKEPTKLMKMFFKACKDLQTRQTVGESMEKKLINQLRDVFPNDNSYNITKSCLQLIKEFGLFPLFKIEAVIDFNNPVKYIASIRQPKLYIVDRDAFEIGYSKPFLTSLIWVLLSNRTKELIEYTLNQYGLLQKQTQVDAMFEIFKDVVNCMVDVAPDPFKLKQNKVSIRTVNALTVNIGIDWIQLLKGLLPITENIDENYMVSFPHAVYFSKLNDLFLKYGFSTSDSGRDDLKLFIMIVSGMEALPDLNMYNFDFWSQFMQKLRGVESGPGITNYCLGQTIKLMPMATAHAFHSYDPHSQELRNRSHEIFDELSSTFMGYLTGKSWLSNADAEKSSERLREMRLIVGFDSSFDVETFVDFYKDIILQPDQHVQNKITMRVAVQVRDMYLKFERPRDPNSWPLEVSPLALDVRYSHALNAILVPPVFPDVTDGVPRFVLYSTFGVTMAKNLMRAFTHNGSIEGNAWDGESARKYHNLLQCFPVFLDQQYSSARLSSVPQSWEISQLEISGHYLSSLEDVAVNYEGYKLAFRTYERLGVADSTLPGLANYSIWQQFFLSSVQPHCLGPFSFWETNNLKPLLLELMRTRTDFVLKNFNRFGDEFQCSAGSSMYPEAMCSMW